MLILAENEGEVIGSESRGSLSFGVLSNAEVKRSEEKVKFRDYVQSDLGKRDLERHFAPVSSQLRTSPAWLQVQPKAGGLPLFSHSRRI